MPAFAHVTSPASHSSRPATTRRMVVLPDPESPIRATTSPALRFEIDASQNLARTAAQPQASNAEDRGHGVGILHCASSRRARAPSGSDIAR